MFNLYGLTKGQKAICDFADAMIDHAGNMPSLPVPAMTFYRFAPWEIARELQKPPAKGQLKIVATGNKEDP
jgi:hypothetical protein